MTPAVGVTDRPLPPRHARLRSGEARRRHGTARYLVAALVASAAISAAPARGQEGEPGGKGPPTADASPFRLYRWEEDYSDLADKQRNEWEQLKYIPLSGLPGAWLSLGGEARYRADAYAPYLFSLGKSGSSWTSHQGRILQDFDLHFGKAFRTFVQFDTSVESGRPVQRAYDRSAPDLRQAFADIVLPVGPGSAMLRGGRQEFHLGDSRWLSVRDPTNIRRSFDGALAEYHDLMFTLRAFAAHPVNILPGPFDDNTSNPEFFRGGYAIVRKPFDLPMTIDAYVYGRQQASATYARGTAAEDRWSGGTRIAAHFVGFETIGEATYQWGTFGNAAISAWGTFGDLGYRFSQPDAPGPGLAPKFGIRGHYASGDDNLKSSTFHNFTGAYPAASVISEMSLISVSNATNVQPYVQVFTNTGLVLGANWNFVHKVSAADSVYGPIGTLITAKNSTSLDVARIGQVDMTWNISRFLQLHALYAHVFARQYIRDAGGRDFDYYRLQVMARW